jgi:hypothetical protein
MITRFIGRILAAVGALTLSASPVLAQSAYLPQYNATLPTVGDTGNVSLQATNRGILRVTETSPSSGADATFAATGADGFNNTITAPFTYSYNYGFNGTTWDRFRIGANNADGVTMLSLGSIATSSYNMLFNGTTWDRLKKPNSAVHLPSAAATTNSTVIKNTATDIFDIMAMNTTASVVFLKIYNKTQATLVVGTDTPILTIALPPSNASFALDIDPPLYLGTASSFAITANAADSDTTAIAAGAVVGINIAFQ